MLPSCSPRGYGQPRGSRERAGAPGSARSPLQARQAAPTTVEASVSRGAARPGSIPSSPPHLPRCTGRGSSCRSVSACGLDRAAIEPARALARPCAAPRSCPDAGRGLPLPSRADHPGRYHAASGRMMQGRAVPLGARPGHSRGWRASEPGGGRPALPGSARAGRAGAPGGPQHPGSACRRNRYLSSAPPCESQRRAALERWQPDRSGHHEPGHWRRQREAREGVPAGTSGQRLGSVDRTTAGTVSLRELLAGVKDGDGWHPFSAARGCARLFPAAPASAKLAAASARSGETPDG